MKRLVRSCIETGFPVNFHGLFVFLAKDVDFLLKTWYNKYENVILALVCIIQLRHHRTHTHEKNSIMRSAYEQSGFDR